MAVSGYISHSLRQVSSTQSAQLRKLSRLQIEHINARSIIAPGVD